MTIAACYPCLEGVVFGADSTTTIYVPDPSGRISERRFTFSQKVFEFGEVGSFIGIVCWGLGSLCTVSYRTLIAEVADRAKQENLPSLGDVACLWSEIFWVEYTGVYEQQLIRARALNRKGKNCTADEKAELSQLKTALSGGFCLGGRWGSSRRPEAYEISFSPLSTGTPAPRPLTIGTAKFWGSQYIIRRVVYGIDPALFDAILRCDKWTGTEDELIQLVADGILTPPLQLPIREAIDLIYSDIYITIKSLKFSQFAPICGGPIEIAVVTTDRPFRWVCHKKPTSAITEGHFF